MNPEQKRLNERVTRFWRAHSGVVEEDFGEVACWIEGKDANMNLFTNISMDAGLHSYLVIEIRDGDTRRGTTIREIEDIDDVEFDFADIPVKTDHSRNLVTNRMTDSTDALSVIDDTGPEVFSVSRLLHPDRELKRNKNEPDVVLL